MRKGVTRLVGGPTSELAACLSSKRMLFGLMLDPLIHYYRATIFAQNRTSQARTLCDRPVAWGKYAVPAKSKVCPVCEAKSRLQSRLSIF